MGPGCAVHRGKPPGRAPVREQDRLSRLPTAGGGVAGVRRQHHAGVYGRLGALPGGFQDYLGERYNEEAGRWEELYGRKIKLTFGLDLYAPRGYGAQALRRDFDRLAQALHREGPEGLRVRTLSCGEVEFEPGAGLFHCPAEALCEGYLYAVADEGGAFLDIIVRGEGRL